MHRDDIYISQTIRNLAKGNPGAVRFLAELSTSEAYDRTFEKLEESGIIGGDIYVLCSDICEGDLKKVVNLLDNCPIDLLKEACSRQDYSGKEMVAKYF